MPESTGNIFLTKENLAFAMPLILVCSIYAYFKYVPLKYGVPVLAVFAIGIQIQSQLKAQKEKKLQNLDEGQIDDIVAGLDTETTQEKLASEKRQKQRQITKAQNKLKDRLAQEKKAETKKQNQLKSKKKKKGGGGNNAGDDADDDDAALLATFAKGSRENNKKKK